MTIELFFSNRLEQLAEKLAGIVAKAHRLADDPFQPLKIIVPNNNLAKWLTLVLARRESIVMNVDFQFLETGLWEMIAALDPERRPVEMLDKTKARLLVLSVLTHIAKGDPDMVPVAGYLFGPDGEKHPDYTIRLWQLSEKLAHLFQEYEYHRTDMIRDWTRQGLSKGTTGNLESDLLARCEQQAYLAAAKLRKPRGEAPNKPVLSLMEYADLILGDPRIKNRGSGPVCPIHFFGLSQVSAFHLAMIDRLKPFYETFIYALNPSREFWEDTQTPAEKRWVKRKNNRLSIRSDEIDEGELLGGPDHPLLAAWGKPGRESVRLLCQLTDYAFNSDFSPVDPPKTVLKQVQNDILTLGNQWGERRLVQDRSLQIFGCPGIYREVETVYQNIIFNLAADDHLQLTDIAVLVPDITVYKPVFGAVFNRLPRRLSYNLIDSRADIESIYGQAVLGLLSLATRQFTRKAVFDLILNPCFLEKWRLKTEDAHIWATWADALNIFHSYEKSSPSAENAPATGRYTWKQGLQRLRLGRIYSGNSSGEIDTNHFQNLVPYADTDTGDTALLEKFCLVVTALARATDRFQLGLAPAAKWREVLLESVEELLAVPTDSPGETIIRQNLFQALDELTYYDQLHPADQASHLDATLITEYIRFRLGAISGGSGDYLTHGITIAELQPMRPIPFKNVYVLGMEEGAFPGKAATSPLDLRLKKRRIGDINLSERNRYLFLETLLAARKKLYISFISRDLQKDRELPPCNVVNQLKRYIDTKILAGKTPFQIAAVPLKGSSQRYLEPGARTFRSDVLVNYDLSDRIACYRATGRWPDVLARLETNEARRVAPLDPDFSVSKKISDGAETYDQIQLGRLKRFLLKPMDESVLRHLGLFEDTVSIQDRIEVEDEPFYSEYPFDWRLVHLPLYQWIDTRISRPQSRDPHQLLDRISEQFYADYHRQGATPAGLFATVDKTAIRKKIFEIETVISPFVDRMLSANDALSAVVIGVPSEPMETTHPKKGIRFDPILFYTTTGKGQSETGINQLNGQLRWFWHEEETGWHVLVPTGNQAIPKDPNKYVLDPVLFYLACRMETPLQNQMVTPVQDWIGTSSLTIHLTSAKNHRAFMLKVDPDVAEKYMSRLIAEYLDRHNRTWLPFETVLKCSINPLTVDPATIDKPLQRQFKDEMMAAFSDHASEFDRLIQPDFPNDLLNRAVDRFSIFGKLQLIAT